MSRQKIVISAPGPILPGSLTMVMAPCGKKNCCCCSNTANLHGPYYRWTGVTDGKRTSVALSPELYRECSSRIANYRKLVAAFERALAHALTNAPWKEKKKNSRQSRSPPRK